MKKVLFLLLVVLVAQDVNAQLIKLEKPHFSGMYFQWGYGRDKYTKSDIHFSDGDNYDFTLYDVPAKDKPDFSAFWDNPLDITIPQNSYRIGFYLNKKHTHAIEINYDHAKYVMVDYQTLRMKGMVNGRYVDHDTFIHRRYIHVEHTNGANFYMINYVGMKELLANKHNTRPLATFLWKAGGGIVVPRSDIYLFGDRLDNKFHVAGYVFGLEFGARYYPIKNLFLEVDIKGGYANYLNSLAIGSGRIQHSFWFGEVLGFVGYDINFGKNARYIRGKDVVEGTTTE